MPLVNQIRGGGHMNISNSLVSTLYCFSPLLFQFHSQHREVSNNLPPHCMVLIRITYLYTEGPHTVRNKDDLDSGIL